MNERHQPSHFNRSLLIRDIWAQLKWVIESNWANKLLNRLYHWWAAALEILQGASILWEFTWAVCTYLTGKRTLALIKCSPFGTNPNKHNVIVTVKFHWQMIQNVKGSEESLWASECGLKSSELRVMRDLWHTWLEVVFKVTSVTDGFSRFSHRKTTLPPIFGANPSFPA